MKKILAFIFIFVQIFLFDVTAQSLKITTINITDSPIISFRIQFRVGSVNEPKGKEGLNQLTANLIAQGGYGLVPYKEMLDKLYPIAGRIGVIPNKEVTTFVARFTKIIWKNSGGFSNRS